MKILITGASGLVGSHLVETLKNNSNMQLLTPSQSELDIISTSAVESYVQQHRPDAVVHFAAHTDLAAAENERGDKNGIVWKINVGGTENLASASKKNNCYFIHISTDYVFSGRSDDQGPYTEDHPVETNPDRLSWYGYTKMKAEEIVRHILTDFAIIRINNPVRTGYDAKPDTMQKILIPFDNGKTLTMFTDIRHSITDVPLLTKVIEIFLANKNVGIFHVSSENTCSPYELATYILKKARGVEKIVKPSSIEDFYRQTGQYNRYSKLSGLNVAHTEAQLNMKFGTWQETIDRAIQSLNTES